MPGCRSPGALAFVSAPNGLIDMCKDTVSNGGARDGSDLMEAFVTGLKESRYQRD